MCGNFSSLLGLFLLNEAIRICNEYLIAIKEEIVRAENEGQNVQICIFVKMF
jgi:hypothetical protein